jgi:hypothetical protein
MKPLFAAAALLVLAGCASYDGRGLVAGRSTAAEVEGLMGQPREKLALKDGDTIWFYPRNPMGRDTYAVRVSPDGRVRSVEQTLTVENSARLVAGTSTTRDVREIFGPPNRVIRMGMQQRDAWEYFLYNGVQVPHTLYVQASADGIVREVFLVRDPSLDTGAYGP